MRGLHLAGDRADGALAGAGRAAFALRGVDLGTGERLAFAGRADLAEHVVFVLLAEIAQGGEDRVRGGLAEAAEGAELDGFCGLLEEVERIFRGAAFDDVVKQREHLLRAFAARHALAAGFVLRELHEEPRDADHAGLLVHDHESAGTDHRARALQGVEIEREVEEVGDQAAAGRAADLHGLEVFAGHLAGVVRHAAADVVHDLAEGGAERDFDEAGVRDVAGEGERLRAGGVLGADFAVLRRAVADDVRHGGERFHVVDHGRLAVEALLRRERRLRHRHAALAFHGGDQGGLFAADERARAFHHADGEVEVRAEEVLAEQAVRLGVGDRLADAFDRQRVFGADVHDAFVGADRASGDHHAFEHGVGVALHDGAVHERARVAFVAVADDVFLVVLGGEREFPLEAGGETAAAATAESGVDHGLADLFRGHLGNGLARADVAVAGDVFLDVVRLDHVVRQHDAGLAGVERDLVLVAAGLAADGVDVDQAVDDLAVDERHVDDLGGVFGLHVAVEDSFGFDAEDRAHLAESLAAGLGEVGDALVFGAVVAVEDDFDVFAGLFQLGADGVADLHGTVGDAAGAAADDDAAFDLADEFLVIRGDLFQIRRFDFGAHRM